MARWLLGVWGMVGLALAGVLGAGCASMPEARFGPADVLAAERDEWRGTRDGTVALRWHVRTVLDARTDPGRAESVWMLEAALTRFEPGAVALKVPLPLGAGRVTRHEARVIHVSSGEVVGVRAVAVAAVLRPMGAVGVVADPGRPMLELEFQVGADEVVEVVVEVAVPGTARADAQPLGVPGVPAGEVLIRVDAPEVVDVAAWVSGAEVKPLVAKQAGREVAAVYARSVAALGGEADAWPWVRWVTREARPKGFLQVHTRSWEDALAPYRALTVGAMARVRAGYAAPFGDAQADVLERIAWVRARPGRAGAAEVWEEARVLAQVLPRNDLLPLERAQLLAWVLEAGGAQVRWGLGRWKARPRLDVAHPVPEAWDVALVWVDGQVVDLGCAGCALGAVQPELAGGQGVLLPQEIGQHPEFIDIISGEDRDERE